VENGCGSANIAAWKVGTGQADSSWQDSRVGSTAEASTSTYFTIGPGHLTGSLAWKEGMGHWSMYDMSLVTAYSEVAGCEPWRKDWMEWNPSLKCVILSRSDFVYIEVEGGERGWERQRNRARIMRFEAGLEPGHIGILMVLIGGSLGRAELLTAEKAILLFFISCENHST